MGWPGTYLSKYKALGVELPYGVCGIGINSVAHVVVQQYQNTGSTVSENRTSNINLRLKDVAVGYYRAFTKASPSERGWLTLPPSFAVESVNNVHIGKGAVSEVPAVLQLLVWANSRKGKKDSEFWGLNDTTHWLRAYCQKWVGLDCLGFVVNCLNANTGALAASAVTNYDMWQFTAPGKLLKTLTDAQEGTVIVYLSGELGQTARHIALLDSTGATTATRASGVIAESLGGVGLNLAEVEITPSGQSTAKGPVFTMRRAKDGSTALVYLTHHPF